MQPKYYLFISFDEKNEVQHFMLHDVEKEKVYNGDSLIMNNYSDYSNYKSVIGFESVRNNGMIIPISKNVFDKSMLLDFNEISKMTKKQVLDMIELEEYNI
jgi:hypothetical protein